MTRNTKPARLTKPRRILLDSSCWLEWLADTPRAAKFEAAFERLQDLVVPVIVIYEVSKKLRREAGDDVAWQALSLMEQCEVMGVDTPLVIEATGNGLPMADSLIYATARAKGAELWTQDAHFKGLPGVRFFERG